MLDINVLRFLTLLFAGILAGFEIAVHYGLGAPPRSLTESAQILLRQAMVLRLRVLAPMLFVPTLAFGISFTVQDRHSGAGWLKGVALGSLGVWIVIRCCGLFP